jgi:hypothetical protein
VQTPITLNVWGLLLVHHLIHLREQLPWSVRRSHHPLHWPCYKILARGEIKKRSSTQINNVSWSPTCSLFIFLDLLVNWMNQ